MAIRAFAERILFGTTWDDKLISLDHFEDRHPGPAIVTPESPGRPQELQLDVWHQREKIRFADVRKLHTEKDRGLVLHFFANHELLALELMALALLKFPYAPEKFRRGLVRTLLDEQEHVRLYRRRMKEIGVEFGEIPVSDFFWKAIAPMDCPMDFVARLSLTLEQANLDYSIHYSHSYQQMGDVRTADILRQIYRDEIGHVKHGLSWFNRWRDPNLSEWEAYKLVLSPPLTPARAKGIGYNRKGRRLAGLSSSFVEELELYSKSRGRCPTVFWFEPNCEAWAAHEGSTYTPAKQPRQLALDFAELPIFLCVPDDLVLVPRRPHTAFLRDLYRAGFSITEFVEYEHTSDLAKHAVSARRIQRLAPWGWSPESVRFLAPLMANLSTGKRRRLNDFWNDKIKALYSKSFSAKLMRHLLPGLTVGRDWLCGVEEIGKPCSDAVQVRRHVAHLLSEGVGEVIIKADFGAAGREQIFIRDGTMRSQQGGWIDGVLGQQGTVVVEPRLAKTFDLSIHVDVKDDGTTKLVGWTRFLTDGRGQFIGALVSRIWSGLSGADMSFIYGHGKYPRRLPDLFAELAEQVGRALFREGYSGPAGIDALVYRNVDALRLKPIVEINPRWTMGRVALALRHRVNSARSSVWVTLNRSYVEAAGFANFKEYHKFAADMAPVVIEDGLISRGQLFTTDPHKAEGFTTALVVADTLEQCAETLGPLGTKLAPAFG